MSYRYRDECRIDCKVFVGNLGPDANRTELETVFGRFGRVKNVWLATNPPGFAFVMFDDSDDAQTAVHRLNDTKICGRYVTVEMSTGKTRQRYRQTDSHQFDRYKDPDYNRYYQNRRNQRSRNQVNNRYNPRHKRSSNSRSRSSTPRSRQRSASFGGSGHQKSKSGPNLKNPNENSESVSRSRH